MTKRALMALLMAAKFETGRADNARYVLNVSDSMWASLRKQGLVDSGRKLTEKGWDVEGRYPVPEDGTSHVRFAA